MSTPTRDSSIDARTQSTPESGHLQELAHEAIQLVRHWLTEASKVPVDVSAQRLAGVLKDPNGLDFTVGFVDGVIRPEDLSVAGRNLAKLAPKVPAFLPWYMRAAVRTGGVMAPVLPQVVIPIARKVLRDMVGHLIVDATDAKLGPAIAKIKQNGVHLNVNLLGEAVLGEREASRRLEGTLKLLARDDVDYVSIKESSTVAPHSLWAFDEAVDHVVEKLTPLYELAASFPKPKFINLDMEEYKDLSLTMAVFTRILDKPEFKNLEAGIVLQAYLPDALSAMQELQEWAAARRANGGAPIKVRVVKGANLPMEQVQASIQGWPLATWGTKQDSDTNYKRVLNYALTPEHIDAVRIGVAGHNLFDVAFAWLLAKERGVTEGIEFEMLLGMATGQATAVRKDVGSLLLYTPVVHPGEFDVAIAYLIRRLEEGASQDNFMSAVFELGGTPQKAEPCSNARSSVSSPPSRSWTTPFRPPTARRTATSPPVPAPNEGFANTPDTDPALPANRAWGRAILDRIPGSTAGNAIVEASKVSDPAGTGTHHRHRRGSWQSLGRHAGRRARSHPAPRRRHPGIPPRRAPRGHGLRDRQDDRTGRPRSQRSNRLRALLRRARQGPGNGRRRHVRPSEAHRRDPAVELPGGDSRGLHAGGTRGGIRRRDQTRKAGPPLRFRHGGRAVGGRCAARSAGARAARRTRAGHPAGLAPQR